MPTAPRDPRSWYPRLRRARLPEDCPPLLVVVVDTEEEFDWSGPFRREHTGVEAMRAVGLFQEACDAREVQPVYVITHPVATQPTGYEPLRRFASEGRAHIGAHLHPWVTPPFDEEVNAFHSYPGNLPEALERAKLASLVEAIEGTFGERPVMYKAGRYGFGPHTAAILRELGMHTDLSPCASRDLSADGGPDYSNYPSFPQWFDEDALVLPAGGGYIGRLPEEAGRRAYRLGGRPGLAWARPRGILARTRLVERIQLSPEGHSLSDMQRLTKGLLSRGERVFAMTLHSPSFDLGHTPFVRNEQDRRDFLDTIRGYYDFFLDELGGQATTPQALRERLLPTPASTPH